MKRLALVIVLGIAIIMGDEYDCRDYTGMVKLMNDTAKIAYDAFEYSIETLEKEGRLESRESKQLKFTGSTDTTLSYYFNKQLPSHWNGYTVVVFKDYEGWDVDYVIYSTGEIGDTVYRGKDEQLEYLDTTGTLIGYYKAN